MIQLTSFVNITAMIISIIVTTTTILFKFLILRIVSVYSYSNINSEQLITSSETSSKITLLPIAEATLQFGLESSYFANYTQYRMELLRDPLSMHRRLCLSRAAITSFKRDSLE